MNRVWLFLIIGAAFVVFSARADSHCEAQFLDIPIIRKEASAGFYSNLMNRKGSVSYESEEIFNHTQRQFTELQKPAEFCKPGCRIGDNPFMYFRSASLKYLTDYDDEEYCRAFHEATKVNPLEFDNNEIGSVEDLIEWIGDFSRGRGELGEKLYEKCDRSCSPRYEYHITRTPRDNGIFSVHASVICGPARDKDDDMYELAAFFKWKCEAVGK